MKIVPLEMSDGDPGYFMYGHVDLTLFTTRVNKEFGEDFTLSDAWHTYLTATQPRRFFTGPSDKPHRRVAGEDFWWLCKPEDAGAFAATFVRP